MPRLMKGSPEALAWGQKMKVARAVGRVEKYHHKKKPYIHKSLKRR